MEEKPQDSKDIKIGTLDADGGKPRTASVASYATRIGGYLTTFIASGVTSDVVSDLAKEDTSRYNLSRIEGAWNVFKNGVKRSIDPKLWKSNLANFAVIVGGISATHYAVKKIEEHTYKKRHGELPNIEQLRQLIQEESKTPPISTEAKSTDWQDKTRKTEETQQTAARGYSA